MLHEVRGSSAFVARVVGGQGGNQRCGVVLRPSLYQPVSFVASRIGDAVEVGLEFLIVVDVHPYNALEEHGEVEVLVVKGHVQAPGEGGNWVVDPCLVVCIDDAVPVEVSIFQTAQTGVFLSAPLQLLFALVETVHHISHDGAICLSCLHKILFGSMGI